MQHLFGVHIVKLRFNKLRRYRGRQPAGPPGGGATLVVLAKCSMSGNGQLWRPGSIDQSSLPFFHKIHCGIMSFYKDKYLVAGQLGLKSSRPLSRLGPGSTRPESTWPGVFSEHSATYMIYGLFCIIFWAKSRMNI